MVKTLHVCDFYASFTALALMHIFSLRLCETVVPLEDPIITETTSTLQEWGVLWKQLYVVSSVVLQHLYHIRSRKTQGLEIAEIAERAGRK